MVQCAAVSKASGDQCRRSAMRGKSVCYIHGGKTPAGIGSPHIRHGRYSKHLPTQLAARYESARADPELLNLSDEIALLDSRVVQLLDGLDAPIEGEGEHHPVAIWIQVERLLDTRRRLVESERKRLVDLQQVMTAEQAMTLLAAVVDTIKRHVNDRATLAAISADISRLVAHRAE